MGFLSIAVILFFFNSCSSFSPVKEENPDPPLQNYSSTPLQPPAQVIKENPPPDIMASLPSTIFKPSEPPSDKRRSDQPPSATQDLPIVFMDDMGFKSLERVIKNQLSAMEAQNDHEKVTLEGLNLTKGDLKNSLDAFLKLLQQNLQPDEFNLRMREKFTLYKAGQGDDKKFLFTGYYTPIIPASPVQTEEYIYPIYRLPGDSPELNFINLASPDNSGNTPGSNWKHLTREQIDRDQALKNQRLEIAWLKDDLERFFLHIQGSAFLKFPNGKLQSVGYAGANKYGYKGIGKLMVKDGLLGKGQRSMQGIKKYLRNHPEKIPKYLYQNKRYIFFSYNDSGPQGSGGGTLVGGRSLATDKSIYPAGGLALIFVRKPVLGRDDKITGWKRTFRFVVDQDTGSDIKGPGRADLFFGIGQRPGIMAGSFKEWGEVYYLIKKN